MTKMVPEYLINGWKVDVSKCRGQSYDSAASMSGRCNGKQQEVLFVYVHSLCWTFVRSYWPSPCQMLFRYGIFFFLYKYILFSVSTKCWAVLRSLLCPLQYCVGSTWQKLLHQCLIALNQLWVITVLSSFQSNNSEKGNTGRETLIIQIK